MKMLLGRKKYFIAFKKRKTRDLFVVESNDAICKVRKHLKNGILWKSRRKYFAAF
jgi:hypothetical protein